MEILGDTKEIEEDDGRTGTTYCLKLKELEVRFNYYVKIYIKSMYE